MTENFVSYNGVTYRVLHTGEGGMWLISYEEPTNPFFYIGDGLERIQPPEEFLEQSSKKKLTAAQQSRLALIHPLLDAQPRSITDAPTGWLWQKRSPENKEPPTSESSASTIVIWPRGC